MNRKWAFVLSLVLMLNMTPSCFVYAGTASDVDSAKAARDKAAAELQESENALAAANAKVDKAQAKYDAVVAKNPEAEAKLEEAEKKLADAEVALDSARKEYDAAFIQAKTATAEAKVYKEERNVALKDYNAAKKEAEDKETALKKAGLNNEEARTEYEKAEEELIKKGIALAEAEKKKLDADAAKLKADKDVLEKLAAVKAANDDKNAAEEALDSGELSEIKTANDDLTAAKAEASEASTKRESAKKANDKAQSNYEEALSKNTNAGPGSSQEAAEAAISNMTSDKDLPGAEFRKLQLRSKKQTNTSITIIWKKVSGAKTYVIYGNKCGKNTKLKKLTTVKSSSSKKSYTKTLKKAAGKKLRKGTYYKFMIVALDSKGNVVSTSKISHVATKGGRVGNVGKVTTKAKKNKVTVKKGKTFKLSGKQVAVSKKLKVKEHRKVTYESTNPKIAKVSKKGVITGKRKGSCYVYAYAQNGVFAKIKVTIK